MSFPVTIVGTVFELLHEYSPIPKTVEFRGARRIETLVNHGLYYPY